MYPPGGVLGGFSMVLGRFQAQAPFLMLFGAPNRRFWAENRLMLHFDAFLMLLLTNFWLKTPSNPFFRLK